MSEIEQDLVQFGLAVWQQFTTGRSFRMAEVLDA